MFRHQNILAVATGLILGFSHGQSVDAGFIGAEMNDPSVNQLTSFPDSGGVGGASAYTTETEDPADAVGQFSQRKVLLNQGVFAQSTTGGNGGATAGGTGVSGFGSGVAPAAILDIANLIKSRLYSYLLQEPELKITPPFSDGIFRPPIG